MFIGLSNSPGNDVGAHVAQVDSLGNMTAERTLDEQGVHDMLYDGDLLIVPGSDPHPDSWAFGNLYTRTAGGVWTKLRNMTNVIHSIGACIHEGELYVGVGAHTGDNQTFQGRVFRSADQGASWSSTLVAYYRVYDVASFDGRLYATTNPTPFQRLYSSTDDGDTWSLVSGVTPALKPRLVVYDGRLFGVTSTGTLFGVAEGNHTINFYTLPETIADNWNVLAVHSSGFYALTGTGDKIYHSEDMGTWNYHCDLESDCVSLTAWDGVGLIVSEKGTAARLLLVPFA